MTTNREQFLKFIMSWLQTFGQPPESNPDVQWELSPKAFAVTRDELINPTTYGGIYDLDMHHLFGVPYILDNNIPPGEFRLRCVPQLHRDEYTKSSPVPVYHERGGAFMQGFVS